jgi:IS30 family transposase
MPLRYYKGHLTKRERLIIDTLRREGLGCRAIGRALGRHHSVIARELARNTSPSRSQGKRVAYLHTHADRRARERRKTPRRRPRLADPRLRAYVETRLRLHWSPEQITGRLVVDFPRQRSMRLSIEAVYRWIHRDAMLGGDLYRHLRRRGKRRKTRGMPGLSRGLIPGRVSIRARGRVVETRRRHGDWEGDLVEGKRGTGRILTLVERKSRYLVATKPDTGKAVAVAEALSRSLVALPEQLRRTLTLDNGKEFAAFKSVEHRTGISVYFADPYCSWQRGTNENTNGLIRQFIPKGCDMTKVSKQTVENAVDALNHRPRKILGFKTPHEVITAKFPGAF